ncbi:hypothetical protein [Henriciella pelagia]|jgi:hypothetical protein|uniref:Uncharacterized protein n=1 Tax=Henriciella pelagia TaxID=1977912 RepID=A0ABQ1JTX6_9PROT|nr:hypothetical protein [Henriciella pelagia]GGB74862.1 hypothetical protein GCM10011503_24460 [Henriciella pelagia]
MAITANHATSSRERTKTEWREFKVDLWLTDLNTTELGIMKHTQHEAASPQFTSDMEIIGQVKEGSERTGILAFRKALWKDGDGMKRRLVIKQFNENMTWRGSMELLMGRSLQLSLGARGVPVPAYSINLARHDQLIQLERSAQKWTLFPEKFSFFIETGDGPRFYRLRRNVIGIGADYTLYDDQSRKVGTLDHRIVNLGGSWKVKLDKAQSYAKLEQVVQMFCAMLRYNGSARRHVKRELEQLCRGRAVRQLDSHERDLYTNPRHR